MNEENNISLSLNNIKNGNTCDHTQKHHERSEEEKRRIASIFEPELIIRKLQWNGDLNTIWKVIDEQCHEMIGEILVNGNEGKERMETIQSEERCHEISEQGHESMSDSYQNAKQAKGKGSSVLISLTR